MIITAKYLGPTNSKGARIRVSAGNDWNTARQKTKYYEWQSELNPNGNYKKAFKEFLWAIDYPFGEWVMDSTDTGMIATNSGESFTP